MPDDDRAWMARALQDWTRVRRTALRLADAPAALPRLVFFNAGCTFEVTFAAGAAPPDAGLAHRGRIELPDGSLIEPTLTSFAATFGPDDRPFMVMALADIWRADPRHAASPDLDRLMRAVFVHEMTHTEQAQAVGAWLKALEARYGLPDALTDDIVQQRFGADAAFREAFERERDLLFRAAAAGDPARRLVLAREAAAAIAARRRTHFTGANKVYAELEDLFLNMEGVANWAAYHLALDEMANAGEALEFTRRGGRFWSQDEGLALFLVIDALVPGWQRELFGGEPVSPIGMLTRALEARGDR